MESSALEKAGILGRWYGQYKKRSHSFRMENFSLLNRHHCAILLQKECTTLAFFLFIDLQIFHSNSVSVIHSREVAKHVSVISYALIQRGKHLPILFYPN